MAPVWFGVMGVALVATILWDAFETILVPRRIGRRVRLTRYFYLLTWRVWRALAVRVHGSSRREGVLGVYGPLSLIGLLACWAAALIVAFAMLQIAATGVPAAPLSRAIYLSGETFFTLGFGDITPATGIGRALAVFEAGLGFAFLGTVVGYLPTLYAAFAQREIEISLMDSRAGSPPTAAEFLWRLGRAGGPASADDEMRAWERWSAQLLETHISYPQLAYYRSQHVNQSWLGTLTAILDSTACILARGDAPATRQAKRTFAMARHALVDITQIFVRRRVPGEGDRLTAGTLERLRERLAGTPMQLPDAPQFESRLRGLRLLYEPYAQALARRLLFELPPWVHAQPRRDNWRGGPWDRELGAKSEALAADEEHF